MKMHKIKLDLKYVKVDPNNQWQAQKRNRDDDNDYTVLTSVKIYHNA